MAKRKANGFSSSAKREKSKIMAQRGKGFSLYGMIALIGVVLTFLVTSCGHEHPVSPPIPWTEATSINFAVISTGKNNYMDLGWFSTSSAQSFERILFYPVPEELQSLLSQETEELLKDGPDPWWAWFNSSRADYREYNNPRLLYWVESLRANELWYATRKRPGSDEGMFCRVWIERKKDSDRVDYGPERCFSVRKFPEIYNRLVREYDTLENPRQLNLDKDTFQ